jgi:CRP-like cAMP-binding protein
VWEVLMQNHQTNNHLLAALTASQMASLGEISTVDLALGAVLEERGKRTDYAYFVEKGLASHVATVSGKRAEIGVTGPEGMVGLGLLVGDETASFDCMMQVEGSASRVGAAALLAAGAKDTQLNRRLQLHARAFSIQIGYNAWSNAHSVLEARLARWLLMVSDRVGAKFKITHEFISIMLGVRRSGVTLAIQLLEGKALIRNKRGEIAVTDRQGLIALADASYGLSEAEATRLSALK